MNIEEERKAFEELRKKLGDFDKGWEFAIWLAAKAHAEEMAKPVAVRIYRSLIDGKTMYSVGKEDGEHINGHFFYWDSASDWAKHNGYRVVGE